MNKKYQSSIEFIILIGVFILLVALFLIVISENVSIKISEKMDKEIYLIASNVQTEIALALESGDGYYREFYIPMDIDGRNYTIEIVAGLVYIRTAEEKHATSIPVSEVNGQLVKGRNTIKKLEGVIYINA